MFQKGIGATCLTVAMLLKYTDIRNPEFIWVLFIIGLVFILLPNNIFTKEKER